MDILEGEEFKKFIEFLEDKEKSNVNIILHDAPDPDAIGSAIGLAQVLYAYGKKYGIYYSGAISHPQNKTLVNVLNIVLNRINNESSLKKESYNICVDCTPKNSVVEDATAVIDHHKNSEHYNGIKINDPAFGACSTIIWNIAKKVGADKIEKNGVDIFTPLLIGIRTDTNDLISENMSEEDFEAYQELLKKSDKEALQKIMNYPLPKYLYEKRVLLHKSGNNYEKNGVFIGGIEFITSDKRDAISILAEEYARMESVNTAIIFAVVDEQNLQISVRSSNVSLDVGSMCKDLFDGYGGGSSFKGGANIPLNFYKDLGENEKEDFWKITRRHMFRKVLKESWVDEDDTTTKEK